METALWVNSPARAKRSSTYEVRRRTNQIRCLHVSFWRITRTVTRQETVYVSTCLEFLFHHPMQRADDRERVARFTKLGRRDEIISKKI